MTKAASARRLLPPAALILCLLLPSLLAAETEFSSLDISPDNALLFQARADVPGQSPYATLFRAQLPDGKLTQLSFYPEQVQFIEDGLEVQIQNRFGVFRSTGGGTGGLLPVAGFPAFCSGSQIQTGRLSLSQASPDGRWLVSLRPVSAAWSRLLLQDCSTGTERVISERVESSTAQVPALWSPDSAFLVYARAQKLYYLSMDQVTGNRVPDEAYRLLGAGSIATARWSPAGQLYFIRARNLFRADPREFFTRTLYASILQTGSVVGEIPFSFDPAFDSWEISPDGSSVLIVKGGRSVFLWPVKTEDHSGNDPVLLPYLQLPSNGRVERVVWPAGSDISLFASFIGAKGRTASVFRISAWGSSVLGQKAVRYDLDGARDIALSPSGNLVAIAVPDGVEIRSASDFSLRRKLDAVDPLKVVWRDEGKLLVAGSALVELVDAGGSSRSLVALSQADSFGFDAASGSVVARNAAGSFSLGSDGLWKAAASFSPRPAASASADWRVYTDAVAAGAYQNVVMLRSVKGLKTSSLFLPPKSGYDPFPSAEEATPDGIFDHGSRLRRREVALSFDAMDGDEGLSTVLNVLADYGIKASFFLNGEFIRRHPADAADIAAAGHEVGSLFFAEANLTDSSYGIDDEFIKRGLARNEDDFFAATGRELSALWHAPFYAVTSGMVSAARSLNYAYVGRDVDPLDWVSAREQYRYPGMFMDAASIVERIMQKKEPGSIIPVRLGLADGGRDDYLWQKLDILLNALISQGYSVVPVSTLMAHAE